MTFISVGFISLFVALASILDSGDGKKQTTFGPQLRMRSRIGPAGGSTTQACVDFEIDVPVAALRDWEK